MSHISFTSLNRILPHVISARKPILIRGSHGIGKSELVYQLAPNVAKYIGLQDKSYVYPIIERRASQMADAGDLMGLPQLDGQVTTFLPMKWFHQACTQPCILFLDEIDRASRDVRQAIFELTDSRKIAGHTLHPDTIVIACINGAIEENHYSVDDMDPAELSRWTVFDVRPTTEDWLDYAKGNIPPQVWDFITQNPSFLEHTQGEFIPNKVYPSRRSWSRLSETLKETDLFDNVGLDFLNLSAAFVGDDAAMLFFEFCRTYSKQVTVEDILIKGQIEKTTSWEINQHMNLIDKMNESNLLQKELSKDEMDNVVKYMFSIPNELIMKLWQVITSHNVENGVALFMARHNGKPVSGHFAKLNGLDIATKNEK